LLAVIAAGIALASCDAQDLFDICTGGAKPGSSNRVYLLVAKFLCIGYHINNTVQPSVVMSTGGRLDAFPFGTPVPSGSTVPSGTTVYFNASMSRTADSMSDPIAKYEWDFEGDGRFVDAGATPTHQYTSGQTVTKTVTLRVTDRLEAVAETTVVIRIAGTNSGSADPPPTASFAAMPPEALPYDTVTFDASGSADPDGQITDYKWNFGDGTAPNDHGDDPRVEHNYQCTGTLTVTLTVTDESGQTGQTHSSYRVTPSSGIPACSPGGARDARPARATFFFAQVRGARLVRAGSLTRAGPVSILRGLLISGRLSGRISGPAMLAPFTRARWTALVTLVANARTHVMRLRGLAVANFPGNRGAACLQLTAVRRGQALPRGSWTLLGGTGKAARLAGGGTVVYGLGADGRGRLAGRLHADRHRPRALPAACRALARH
jgi:PKD repeat protein